MAWIELDRSAWTAYSTTQNDVAHAPIKAIDSDPNTFWQAALELNLPQDFWVDLGSAKSFDRLEFQGVSIYNPQSIDVFVSDDGSTWGTAIASTTWSTTTFDVINHIDFSIQTKQWVKLRINSSEGTYAMGREFRLYKSEPTVADNLANWSDSLNLFLPNGYNFTDTLTLTDYVVSSLALGLLSITATENLNSWGDGRIIQYFPGRIDFAVDDLAQKLADLVAINFSIFFNNVPRTIAESLNNWTDAIVIRATINQRLADTFTMSDSYGNLSNVYLKLGDSLGMLDGYDVSRVVLPIVSDSLNHWTDYSYQIINGNLIRSVSDSLNNWNDLGSAYEGTAFISYIRRYLNDVV